MSPMRCPGAAGIKGAPTLAVKSCPECGAPVEIFSNEIRAACGRCGFIIHNDLKNCIEWCKYAKECAGETLYNKFKER